jgi:hypothetical protein
VKGSFVTNGYGVHRFVREDGVTFKLKGIQFGDMRCDMDVMEWEYRTIAPEGEKTVAWLRLNFPDISFIDPKLERIRAYAAFMQGIEERAIERFKRENGL